jgi:hypothetical protein
MVNVPTATRTVANTVSMSCVSTLYVARIDGLQRRR